MALAAVAALVGATATSAPAPIGAAPVPPAAQVPADDLRLNQVQVVGSHNSYHLAASPEESAVRRQFIGAGDDALQYAHAPLDEQLTEQKVRQIELDIFRDDEGGLYSEPLLRQAAGHGPYDPAMDQPGTKVLHVQDVDYRSTCLTLVACLQTVETWSDANPGHLPVAILLELKDGEVGIGDFPFVVPEPWTGEAMDALDDEIRSVMEPDDLITPDDVRDEAATLEEAVLETGWPTLGASRGKVMFLMDNGGGYRTDYLAGHPTLEDRVMFTNAQPGQADAAFVKVNDSRADEDRIRELVDDGYVVRTRADAETAEARTGDTSGRDAAFRSGAQWVSTDYPVAEYARPFGTGFVVEIPGGTIARCNPVSGPVGCVAATIEPFPDRAETPYVRRLYQVFLGRAPSNADGWFWARRLERGASRGTVARALAHSPEGDRGPFLRAVSQDYLGRAMDATSRTYWAGRLAAGWPLDNVRVATIASDEVYDRVGGAENWVDELYVLVLGRHPDRAGLAYFLDRLASGSTRSTIARQVLGSVEGRRVRSAALATELLERPVAPGQAGWLADILARTRDERDLAVAVVTTPEFHDLVEDS